MTKRITIDGEKEIGQLNLGIRKEKKRNKGEREMKGLTKPNKKIDKWKERKKKVKEEGPNQIQEE